MDPRLRRAAPILLALSLGFLLGRVSPHGAPPQTTEAPPASAFSSRLPDAQATLTGTAVNAPQTAAGASPGNVAGGIELPDLPPVAPAPSSAPAAAPAAVTGNLAFNLLRIETVVKGETVQACLVFTGPLDFAAGEKPADFIKVEPAIEKTILLANQRLCVSGFSYGQKYTITARRGLHGAGSPAPVMMADQTLGFDLGRMAPVLAYADSGFILPRTGTETLPLRTININKVHLEVERITDRVLARTQLGANISDNNTNDEDGYYDDYDSSGDKDPSLGASVYKGDIAIAAPPNQAVITGIPVAKLLGTRKPGAYRIIVSAEIGTPPDRQTRSRQRWIVDSDIMLTTHRAADGLHVFARSLATAKPLAGTDIALLAANNDELGRATTDANGQAVFPAGLLRGERGLAPRMVMAYLGTDFSVIDLDQAGLDLSDRGVAGRAAPGPVDAFLYSDRGIYRPGEVIRLSGLVRDRLASAIAGQKLSLSLRRPDDIEAAKFVSLGNDAGLFTSTIPIAAGVTRGTWRVALSLAGSQEEIASLPVEVQDFIPQRLRVTAEPKSKMLMRHGDAMIDVSSRFLYGAPAADLAVNGTVVLRRDLKPFGDANWQFGILDDAGSNQPHDLTQVKTDASGHAVLTLSDDALTRPTGDFPLFADIDIAVTEPGGRATNVSTTIPVFTRDITLGLRDMGPISAAATLDDDSLPERFLLAAFSPQGEKRAAQGLNFSLVEEVTEFGYFGDSGNLGGWRWRTVTHDRPVTFGPVATEAGKATEIVTPPLGFGRFRLEVTDPKTGAKTAMRFYAGGYRPAGRGSPEKLDVMLLGKPPRAGETAHLKIIPPFAGEALITVENDRVLQTATLSLPAGGATIDVKASKDWGAGAYVMATLYRPLSQARGHAPVRAIGLAWVPLDPKPRTLSIAIDAPPVLRPRAHADIPLTISNAPANEPVYVTLAAVDEGILQLTRFATPDPESHFFGQRQLAVTLRDDYAKLLAGDQAVPADLRSGGDMDGAGLSVVPTRTTALFSGIVQAGPDGRVTIPLDLPDFNGGLRFMALAASPSAIGHGDRQTPSRDPVVAEASLPRFLAPGDKATLTLLAHNVDMPAGTFHLKMTASGPLGFAPIDSDLTLAAGAQQVTTYPIGGVTPGVGQIDLTLTGPDHLAIARNWQIEVRPAYQAVSRVSAATQNPGESFTVLPDLAKGLYQSPLQYRIAYSATGKIDLAGLLTALDTYPFLCTEQLVSRALPLLSVPKIAAALGKEEPDAIRLHVQQAIDTLLSRQDPEGGIGLWRAGDRSATPYLGAYATDFLLRAKEAGYAVPQEAIDRAFKGLDLIKSDGPWRYEVYWWTKPGNTWRENVTNIGVAYTHLLKTRAGQGDLGEMRYFAETTASVLPPLATAQLATALTLSGDALRGKALFDRAERLADDWGDSQYASQGDFYRSQVRDSAEMLLLAKEIGDEPRLRRLLDKIEHLQICEPIWCDTHKQAWLATAAGALIERSGGIAIGVRATIKRDPGFVTLVEDALSVGKGLSLSNAGTGPVLRSVTVRGLPKEAPPASTNGFKINKQIWTTDGKPADLAHLRQGQRLIVQVQGETLDGVYHQTMVADLLPSCFEIERFVPPSTDGAQNGFPFLNKLSNPRMQQKQDDRMLAAVDFRPRFWWSYRHDTDDDQSTFNIAYVVRVVTPGSFVLPAASIRDMYRADLASRTETGRVVVAPAQ